MQLDVESVRTFLAVLDHGGMTRAAEHLGLSQSAVSWKIKRLEAKVGRPLLLRDGHSLRPSPLGRDLLSDGRQMVDLHDRAVRRLQSPGLTGSVRVGSNEGLDAVQMAAVLGRFRDEQPGVTVEFLVDRTGELCRMVANGLIDIALIQVSDDDLEPDDEILGSERLVWAAHRDLPFDTDPVPLVTFGEGCFYRPISEPLLDAAGIQHKVAISVHTSAGVHAAIEAGLGVGVLSERYLTGDVTEWERASQLPSMPDVLQVARVAPASEPDIVAALLDIIRGEAASGALSAA